MTGDRWLRGALAAVTISTFLAYPTTQQNSILGKQIDHLLQRRLRRRLRLQGTGNLGDRLRKAAVDLVLHDMTPSGPTWSVRMLGFALPHLLVQPGRAVTWMTRLTRAPKEAGPAPPDPTRRTVA